MFIIKLEQLNKLDQIANQAFHKRLLLFLRNEIPEGTATMSDAELMQRIVESERRASKYKIESEAGISQFVCLTFSAGLAFDDIPEVREFLTLEGFNPEEMLDELVNYLSALEENVNAQPIDVLLAPEA
jgi:hypothetical protein